MIEKALKQIESAKKLITEMTGFLAEVENKINTKKIFELWEQKVSNSGE